MLFWLKHRSQKLGFPVRLALDIGIISSIAGLLSARMFHVFYEFPEFYFENPSHIFRLWEGGYVILPGLFGAVAVGLVWIRRAGHPVLPWLDLFAPILALGYSLGRWACFFQGCCYGKPTESFFGVHFHHLEQSGETIARYPTQIFASIGEFIVFCILIAFEKRKGHLLRSGQLFGLWLIGHGLNRIIMELLRDDPRGPLLLNLGVSFWLAGGIMITGLFFLRLR